ncbi:DUF6526 family protein [Ferruginibacter lapsinanis]|uniref:DUF6526 family protein n=1 Tax=Ferruginibacter lapsinanis TaxID=563172 RepID=UPI001E55961F|nr:DUF6526 family protein [Ferruginibacter lapsinanis]UEG48609.1 DUF6526 family protein [Ferruginibacter lapsinanis]
MQTQNFKNHTQYVPFYHFGVYGGLLALLIGSVVNYLHSAKENIYSASLLILASLLMILIAFFGRSFALKAQDRAIRAEEKLRYFIATGQQMDSRLHLGQIIALRFASDGEFVALAKKAADENLAPKEIKAAIQNWRGDYHRV